MGDEFYSLGSILDTALQGVRPTLDYIVLSMLIDAIAGEENQ